MSNRSNRSNNSNNRGGGRRQGQNNRRGGHGGREKRRELTEEELRQRREGFRAAKHWESMGFYVWAEHWRQWAVSPLGTPQPPNYHTPPDSRNTKLPYNSDKRNKMYRSCKINSFDDRRRRDESWDGSLETFMGRENYRRWRDRDHRRVERQGKPYTESDTVTIDGNEVHVLETMRRNTSIKIVQNREKTNRELGRITNDKGHPYLLIRKLNEARKSYPEFYRGTSGGAL